MSESQSNQHLLEVIPPNLVQNDVDHRIIEAIGNQEAKFFLKVDNSIIGDNLEGQPDEVIWHLLWENHLIKNSEGLALAKSKKERADLIRSAVELHRSKGTPYAIERALEVVGVDGHNEEWFEFDGEPYHFWVELSLGQKLSDLDLIREMIMEYKNERSWFDGFVVMALEQGFLYWDDSYSYPVYYKDTNDFWGMAKTINVAAGGTSYIDDSYSYPVYYDVNEVQFKNIDTGVGLLCADDSYSYPVFHESCGDFETPHTTSVQFGGVVDMIFEAYSYPTYYPICGEFEAGG